MRYLLVTIFSRSRLYVHRLAFGCTCWTERQRALHILQSRKEP